MLSKFYPSLVASDFKSWCSSSLRGVAFDVDNWERARPGVGGGGSGDGGGGDSFLFFGFRLLELSESSLALVVIVESF